LSDADLAFILKHKRLPESARPSPRPETPSRPSQPQRLQDNERVARLQSKLAMMEQRNRELKEKQESLHKETDNARCELANMQMET
jgi:predicted RNase H-like nuclease (RuvC/YqgF family)